MIPASHPFFRYINEALSVRVDEYPDDDDDDDRRRELDVQPTHPIEFIDRHLAAHLQLMSVRIARDIPKLLADFLEGEISAYFSKDRTLDPSKGYEANDDRDLKHLTKGTSKKISELYQHNFFDSSKFAGQFYLCPEEDFWQSFPILLQDNTPEHNFLNVGALELSTRWKGKHAESSMLSKSMLTTLEELHNHGSMFAIWHFYPYNSTGENLVTGMREYRHFPWEIPRTKGFIMPSLDLPAHLLDGDKLVARFLSHQSASLSRLKLKPRKKGSSERAQKNIVPPVGHRARPYRTDHKHYIQRAWTQAVQNDATFLIFNCGRYERIGIRHRQSQTLFLSEPIDSTTQRGIPYGKIQAGLHTAIVHDALDRHKRRQESIHLQTDEGGRIAPSRKRKTDDTSVDDVEPVKRLKAGSLTETYPSQAKEIEIQAALSLTKLALVSLNFELYKSSQPSCFVRRGPSCVAGFDAEVSHTDAKRQNYRIEETVSICLHEEVGSGSTGTVYRGTADLKVDTALSSGCPVIIKMVFHSHFCDIAEVNRHHHVVNPKTRLRNEYEIYRHLAKTGAAASIPSVYGMFEDVESNTLALIMSDGGSSLYLRESLKTGIKYPKVVTTISKAERENALAALKQIHQANIRHRDIRAANIVVNNRNEVVMVDFDLAERSDNVSAKTREVKCLQHILDGLGDTDEFYSFRY